MAASGRLAILVLCVGAAVGTAARGPQVASALRPPLEVRLASMREAGKLPAVAGAVFTSERIVEQGVIGVRRLGADAVAATDDLWHIGSITKSFTATLVARLVDRGEWTWTQTLGDLVGPERARAYASATIEQVLSHRAGLPANIPQSLTVAQSSKSVEVQRQHAVDAILSVAPIAPPGEQFLYSNAGYILIGALLEARTGKTWEDLVRAEVTSPLKLLSAGFGPPGATGAVTQPRGHRRMADGTLVPVEPGVFADNPPLLGPAGRLHMTVEDLARWGQEHLRGERGRDGLVRAATFQHLHRPSPAGATYALGWAFRTIGGRRVLWHNGSNTIWYAAVAFDPDADVGVALVTNGSIGAQATIEAGLAQVFGDWVTRR